MRIKSASEQAAEDTMLHIFGSAYAHETDPAHWDDSHNESIKPLETIMADNHKVMGLFTQEEAYKLLLSEGIQYTQGAWQKVTDSDLGRMMSDYGANAIDAFGSGKALQKWGGFGVTATFYHGQGGIPLVRLEGDRLRAIVAKNIKHKTLRLTDPRLIDLGIGKTARQKAFTGGIRITLLFAAAYRTIDWILNDQTHFIDFIGKLTTDIPKAVLAAAIAESLIALVTGVASIASTGGMFLIVVAAGLIATTVINDVDDYFNLTDTLIDMMKQKIQKDAEQSIEDAKAQIYEGEHYTVNPFQVLNLHKLH